MGQREEETETETETAWILELEYLNIGYQVPSLKISVNWVKEFYFYP